MRIDTCHWLTATAAIAAWPLLHAGAGAAALLPCLAAAACGGWLAARGATTRRRARPAAAAVQTVPRREVVRRDEHLARTVHELRTPLCSVAAALELLRDEHTAAAADLLADARLATDQLHHLVDDLLDGAAMASGRLRLTVGSHRVRELLAATQRLLRRQAERHGVRIATSAVDGELAVRTDPHRFQQIVGNLVRNALAVAPVDSAVQIDVHADRHRVRFAVVDRGPGVPTNLRQRLFTPFATGANGGRGTGLGLHVSMRLVQQMGGRIGHAATGEGTSFWFELPRAAARPVAAPRIEPADAGRAAPLLHGDRAAR